MNLIPKSTRLLVIGQGCCWIVLILSALVGILRSEIFKPNSLNQRTSLSGIPRLGKVAVKGLPKSALTMNCNTPFKWLESSIVQLAFAILKENAVLVNPAWLYDCEV